LPKEGGLLSRASWKLKPTETLRLDSVRIVESKYVSLSNGDRQRIMSVMRVSVPSPSEDPKVDYGATIRATLQQQRMKGLFDGLYRAAVPFVYIAIMKPDNDEGDNEIFEFDLVVGTWVDAKGKKVDEAVQTLEERASVLAATLTVALPESTVRRLTRNDLRNFLRTFLLPSEPKFPQAGNASMVSSLGSFEGRSPTAGSEGSSPQFYVPNSSESGRTGITIGAVRSSGGDFHDFKLQLDDLKRHVVILGMTGSGKSTSAATIVRQVVEMGLPALILDWHDEYAETITRVGGSVFAPGKDGFAVNPILPPTDSDTVEHIATVTDIFTDIYHFTHPQAYMFRNAMQKVVSESSDGEVPRLSSLVNEIERYPLRSAYDNETKVALLRRIVPLTQGQVGRALDVPSTFAVDDILGKPVCIELGHIKDGLTRSIFSDIMMKMIYEYRVGRKASLEHLTVVEEARNVAPARRPEDPPSVGERMISELRKFGEGLLFVAQFPTQVASEVIKNSGVRIVHRIAWPEDLNVVSESLALTREQKEHITKLAVGEAVVSLSRLQKPILVQFRSEAPVQAPSNDVNFSTEA